MGDMAAARGQAYDGSDNAKPAENSSVNSTHGLIRRFVSDVAVSLPDCRLESVRHVGRLTSCSSTILLAAYSGGKIGRSRHAGLCWRDRRTRCSRRFLVYRSALRIRRTEQNRCGLTRTRPSRPGCSGRAGRSHAAGQNLKDECTARAGCGGGRVGRVVTAVGVSQDAPWCPDCSRSGTGGGRYYPHRASRGPMPEIGRSDR
jgi:hypothetical protein